MPCKTTLLFFAAVGDAPKVRRRPPFRGSGGSVIFD